MTYNENKAHYKKSNRKLANFKLTQNSNSKYPIAN